MEPMRNAVNRALMQTKGQPTTVEPISMPTSVGEILSQFELLGDPELIRMKEAAEAFLRDLHRNYEPRWLSFAGTSGAGKTYLCNLIRKAAPAELKAHPSFKKAGILIDWPDVIWKLRNEETRAGTCAEIDESIQEKLVLVDDIGGSKDSEFSASALFRLLNKRMGKWTLITSNRSPQQIAESIDGRITSRLARHRNVCIDVQTIDYALRKR